MNKQRHFLLYIILGIFASCSEPASIPFEKEAKIKIQMPKIGTIKFLKYSEVFDSIEYIRLETKDESLIGRIDAVKIYKGLIYILDQVQSKAVLVFDLKGKFIRRIGSIGNGPGEYDEPNDIAIDDINNEIMVWNNSKKKILFYNMEGTFNRELKLPAYVKTIGMFAKDTIAAYLDISTEATSLKYNLALINDQGTVVATSLEDSNWPDFGRSGFNFFRKFKDEFQVTPSYTNDIFVIKTDTLRKKYSVDFGEQTIPQKFLKKFSNKFDFDEELKKTNYATMNNFSETENFLLFSFVSKGQIYQGYYSKKTGRVKFGNLFINDKGGLLTGGFMSSTGDSVVGFFESASILSIQKTYEKINNFAELRSTTLTEIKKIMSPQDFANAKIFLDSLNYEVSAIDKKFVNEIKSSDNPIIVIKHMKSF
jgi:hypothetical protein